LRQGAKRTRLRGISVARVLNKTGYYLVGAMAIAAMNKKARRSG